MLLMNNRNHMRLHGQSGFTLIEVLVAVIVLSIGLVGVAGLQVVSLQNNQSAFMRSQASALAYDLADRMRANVPGANAGMYDPTAKATTASCKSTTGCTTQQMAQNDLYEWDAAIATYLPDGQGFVCIDSTPDDGTSAASPECDGTGTLYAIKIWWDDNRDGTIDTTAGKANPERLAITIQL